MAENKNENQQSQEMLDKTYVVEWWDPSKLQNADVNLSQYWDDSSEANYNNPSLWGWENTKYTGENTLGSQVAYNPNATVEGLDPNYLYWQEAQMQNSKEANYIAKRNDEIASALYNAWKTSIQDVANFLDSQKGYYNSVGNERANTVTAVWKRIGQIAEQNKKSDEPKDEQGKTSDDALNNMESDLNKSTGGKIYGKVTAEEWNPKSWIDTLEDENSVYKSMNEARIQAFKSLQSMSDESIATSIITGVMSGDSQSMRDLMQYDPAKYERVKLAEKQIRGQMTINSITNWEEINSTVVDTTDVNTELTSYAVNNSTSSTSATQLLKSIDTILSSNDAASTASEQMASIEKDMATLKNRLMNLKKEANTVFKWDVPQYIVNAYVANRTQEIQNNMQILEDRYNAAYSRYQNEVQQAQWDKEYDLKKQELQLKKEQLALQERGVDLDWAKFEKESTQWTWLWKMRTERNNNPTAMTTDYAKMMWLELGVDYEIWDSFIGSDWRTYYTAKFIWDPIETAIKAFDMWAANNVFWSQGWVLWHWHLWISNKQWLEMTDWEKRDVINKILQKEWGEMTKMLYYNSYSEDDNNWERKDGVAFNLNNSPTYQSLTNNDKTAVKQLLNLAIDKSTIYARWNNYNDPSWIFAAVGEINPSWTANQYADAHTAEQNWTKARLWGYLDRNSTAWTLALEIYNLIDEIPDATLEVYSNEYNIKTVKELINKLKMETWNEPIVVVAHKLDALVSEYAGALKWWSSALSDQDVQRQQENIYNLWLSQNQIKWGMTSTLEVLYDKAETAADEYSKSTMERPNSIRIPEVADFIAQTRPQISKYFKYNKKWGNAPTYDGGTNNKVGTWNLDLSKVWFGTGS